MNCHRVHRPILWIAILAVLVGVFAPSLTALLASSGKSWIEICTSTGTTLIATDTGDAPDDRSSHTVQHCPYCRLQQDLPAIAPASGVPDSVDGSGGETLRPSALSAPPRAVLWPAHHSRAPPQFS